MFVFLFVCIIAHQLPIDLLFFNLRPCCNFFGLFFRNLLIQLFYFEFLSFFILISEAQFYFYYNHKLSFLVFIYMNLAVIFFYYFYLNTDNLNIIFIFWMGIYIIWETFHNCIIN